MTVRAVIVGIEKYADGRFDVAAPAANAIAVARWARNRGIAAADIFLFVSSLDPAHAATIDALGLRNRGTAKDDIETVLRRDLRAVDEGSRLLFYWSGHGMADSLGHRLFFCSDFDAQLDDRVFNATLFFRDLRSDAYAGYRDQLILADVCGTNSLIPVRPARYDPKPTCKRNQLIYFATPEGGYALAVDGQGVFTTLALKVLVGGGDFPSLKSYKARLGKELEDSDLPHFLLVTQAEDGESSGYFGRAPDTGNAFARSLVDRLVGLRIKSPDAESSFRATVTALKNPRLLAAEGLTGMVAELSGLRDPVGGAPRGLVQFVLRLGEALPEHRAALADWLAKWAAQETVDDQSDLLKGEGERSALIVEVGSNQRGEVTDLTPTLRSLDQTQSRGPRFQRIPTPSWEAVDDAMQAVLKTLDQEGFRDIAIHFIVDCEVFDRPFHRLRGLSMPSLGQDFGVLLHHCTRAQSGSGPWRVWQRRVDKISCKTPASLKWARCAQHLNLPQDEDLCLADWLPDAAGKERLRRLVRMGVPFIYWAHSEAEPDAERDLTRIVNTLGSLSASDMSDGILTKRIAEVVSSGSLLWDDASFHPFGG